jgi:hypothetical protein
VVNQVERDSFRGNCSVDHGPAVRRLSTTERKSAASGQTLAKAMDTTCGFDDARGDLERLQADADELGGAQRSGTHFESMQRSAL